MCTWIVEKADIMGSGKGASGWFPLKEANVCYDHPAHAPRDHGGLIDFVTPGRGVGARVAVELTAESARGLIQAIQAALDAGEAQHLVEPALAGHSHS